MAPQAACPRLGRAGLAFEQIANPAAFARDPTLAWGFYGHRLALYRRTVPHAGFAMLQQIGAALRGGLFVFTSNVDGQFQKAGFDAQVDPALKIFFYMPYEHSESLDDQQRALDLFRAVGNDEYMKYAQLHYDLIARFGRFPHRNEAMGRVSTQEERDYLAAGWFSG